MDENINLEWQKEKMTFKWYSIFGYLGIWIICYVVGNFFLFEVLKLELAKDESRIMIGEIILITLVHLIDFVISWVKSYELNKWWEEKIKEDVAQATEQLKKELLDTKTELLLTQNKLRDCPEKSSATKSLRAEKKK